MERLDPTLDLVFKLLLTRKPELLQDMLEGILAKPIASISILDADIPGDLVGDKEIILDIRVELADGTRVDVEMQVRVTAALTSRLLYYAARDYANQLGRGDDYRKLTPTVVIVWLVEPLFPELEQFHSVFELRDRHTHLRFSDQLAIHVLQLSCLSPSGAIGYDGRVERWARFLTEHEDAQLDRLAVEDPIMKTAKQALEEISCDPDTQRRARERADAVKLYEMDLEAVRTEAERRGERKGERRGQARLLLDLLAERFGALPEPIRTRIEAAAPPQLQSWARRVLSAQILDEVFAA